VVGEVFLEKITVDGLGGSCPLPGRDNHLTICGADATGCIEAAHIGSQIQVDDDFPIRIESPRKQKFRRRARAPMMRSRQKRIW